MPAPYTGDQTATQAPSPAPSPDAAPISNLIADGDPRNASSLAQQSKMYADWIDWLRRDNSPAFRGLSRSFDGAANPTSPGDLLNHSGTAPFSCLDEMPRYVTSGTYAVQVTAGRGWIYDVASMPANVSPFHPVKWATANLTHGTPVTNSRTDIIVLAQDGTVSIVAGTPGPTYPPPAVPAGSIVLFYVFIPLTAATSADFAVCRGTWRRAAFPGSGSTGILSGANLFWDTTVDPSSTSANIFMGAPDGTGSGRLGTHRVLIDGELLEWYGMLSDSTGGRAADTANNPFGSAAPANNDKPYYIYLAGGRHNQFPNPATVGGVTHLNPCILVESTTPPNPHTGKPTANMTVNGVTVIPDGAVYIGLGWVVKNSTRRRACVVDGDITAANVQLQVLIHTAAGSTLESIGDFSVAGGCQPSISTKLRCRIVYTNNGGAAARCSVKTNSLSVSTLYDVATPYAPASGLQEVCPAHLSWNAQAGSALYAQAGATGDTMSVVALGFNHRVLRYGGTH